MDDIKDNEMINNEETAENSTGNDKKSVFMIPFVVHESDMARMERIIAKEKKEKELIMKVHLAIEILLIGLIVFGVYEWTRYDYTSETTTYQQDGEGFNNLNTGTQGDVLNEPETNKDEKDKNSKIE